MLLKTAPYIIVIGIHLHKYKPPKKSQIKTIKNNLIHHTLQF